ncbi:MAG: glycoside hydrolase family 88 protein, partial [Caldilineaceae bacterium]|nr:glycoside hydrolase family 88 protein [Caldilineaceae bacterium]
RETVLANFRRQADALLPLQSANGLWPTVVDEPSFYLESSGSALAGAAIIEGVARGWLDAARFGPAAQRARDGILGELEGSGRLGSVSGPTGPMLDIAAYNAIPTDVLTRYGQGTALLIGAADLDAASAP